MAPKSLSHAMPRPMEMYTLNKPDHPFPPAWSLTHDMSQCLPPVEDLYAYLRSFHKRARGLSFPHIPDELTRKEIDRFLESPTDSALRYPDWLALIFAAAALGIQAGVYDRSGDRWAAKDVEEARRNGDMYSKWHAGYIMGKNTHESVAAAMQSLRRSSFLGQPTLVSIQTLLMLGPYLINTGRFLDAWSLFGLAIRLGHAIGLHRNPKYLHSAPDLAESTLRKAIWWHMLHVDQQYSMTLGRPLGISGVGDCPYPEPATSDPLELRVDSVTHQLTILARQILGNRPLTDTSIDAHTDKLTTLWDTMPTSLRFDPRWTDQHADMPEWPLDIMAAGTVSLFCIAPNGTLTTTAVFCKIHSYLILLNRQRTDTLLANPSRRSSTATGGSDSTSHLPPSRSAHPDEMDTAPDSPLRGRARVIQSSIELVQAFRFFHARNPWALVDWTIGQQAFNACMILLLDGLETGNTRLQWLWEAAYAIFVELDREKVHELAGVAVARIGEGVKGFAATSMQQQRQQQSTRTQSQGAKPPQHSRTGFFDDTLMGSTGMFLLEDNGLQSLSSAPLHWPVPASSLTPSSVIPTPRPPQTPHAAPLMSVQAAAPAYVQQHTFPATYATPFVPDFMVQQQGRGFALPGAAQHHAQPGVPARGGGGHSAQQRGPQTWPNQP